MSTKFGLIALLIVLCLGRTRVTSAQVTAYYHPVTGNVYLENHVSGFSTVVILYSKTGQLSGLPNSELPVDIGDAPFLLTYFDVPPTTNASPGDLAHLHNLGSLLPNAGFETDLEVRYITAPDFPEMFGKIVVVPEPSSLLLLFLHAGAFLSVRRIMVVEKLDVG